jgi:hypothetical protein
LYIKPIDEVENQYLYIIIIIIIISQDTNTPFKARDERQRLAFLKPENKYRPVSQGNVVNYMWEWRYSSTIIDLDTRCR